MWWRNSRWRSGVTLIEVLVAASVLAVAFGLIMGLLIETRKGAIAGQNRIAMQAHAEQIAEEIVGTLLAAAPPGSLDSSVTTAPLRCEPDHCVLVSSQGFDGRDFYASRIANDRIEVATESDDRGEVAVVTLSSQAFDSPRMSPVVREKTRTLGTGGSRFSASVAFQYAASPPQGVNSPLAKRLKPGRYPVLIEAHVTVRDTRKILPPYELVTAVRM